MRRYDCVEYFDKGVAHYADGMSKKRVQFYFLLPTLLLLGAGCISTRLIIHPVFCPDAAAEVSACERRPVFELRVDADRRTVERSGDISGEFRDCIIVTMDDWQCPVADSAERFGMVQGAYFDTSAHAGRTRFVTEAQWRTAKPQR